LQSLRPKILMLEPKPVGAVLWDSDEGEAPEGVIAGQIELDPNTSGPPRALPPHGSSHGETVDFWIALAKSFDSEVLHWRYSWPFVQSPAPHVSWIGQVASLPSLFDGKVRQSV
jgi:hypothetical protein